MKRIPTPTDTALDMLSAGTGASSVTVDDPRPVVEPSVGASPDDVSEGHRLNLVIHNFAPSEVSSTPDIMSLGSVRTAVIHIVTLTISDSKNDSRKECTTGYRGGDHYRAGWIG